MIFMGVIQVDGASPFFLEFERFGDETLVILIDLLVELDAVGTVGFCYAAWA